MRNDKSPSPAELETPIREKLQDNPMTNPIPPRALPQCTCQSDYHIIPREYATGTHYWLSCIACGARGHQAAPKRLLPSEWHRGTLTPFGARQKWCLDFIHS
jgi:hypothetical protein